METDRDDTDVSDLELSELFHGYTLDHDTAAHYRGRLRRQLLINRCVDCRTNGTMRPSRSARRVCLSGWSPTPVSGRGTIFMAVFLHQGPPVDGIDYSTPYPVITVELDEQTGLRFSSTVVGSAQRGHPDRSAGRAGLDRAERCPRPGVPSDDTGKSV